MTQKTLCNVRTMCHWDEQTKKYYQIHDSSFMCVSKVLVLWPPTIRLQPHDANKCRFQQASDSKNTPTIYYKR